ncbi:MAG: DUF4249 domain-containing protein [Bacteroidales bacterium]|nr:DUF4249 domain-containing protein [Bacteroidales bacterium]
MKKISSYFIVFMLLLTSCQDGEFINYRLPSPPHWLGISGYICEDSTCVTLTRNHLWSTQYVPDTSIYIHNATVILYEDGIIADTLRLVSIPSSNLSEVGYYYLSHKGGIAGKKYRIEAHHPNWPTAWTETIMPHPSAVTIDTIVTSFQDYPYSEIGYDTIHQITTHKINISLVISDQNNQSNFYQLRFNNVVSSPNPLYENSYLYQENLGYWPLFSDRMFDGKSITITAKAWLYPDEMAEIFLIGLNEDGYKYFLSRSKYEHLMFDFSSEPIDIYSNVHSGFGIFYGITTFYYQIKIN